MLNQAIGWQRSELEQIDTHGMDAERLKRLIANIDRTMQTIHSSLDSRKLRDLKSFFELELKKRD